ncbi:MAG: spondin domain-containing protein, partial [Verrucomicrobia bacterium]|nr:spondin domain-containing protein [Verrucomicrobiota bacterium]
MTLDSDFPFCHQFNYATSIPNGTVFAAGESKVFTVAGLNAADSDLWLYRKRNFGSATEILSGLKWGSAPNIGRAGVATDAGIWSGTASFAPAPNSDQSLKLTGANPFSPENWSVGEPDLGQFSNVPAEPNFINVRVTVINKAPSNGTFLTPPWVGFHDGGFDSYDGGSPSSPGIERIAEDGNPGTLRGEFLASGAGTTDGVLNAIGPIAPGASVSKIFTIDANAPMSRYFSYASMVIPSNDAYVANGDPVAHAIFDAEGTFIPAEFTIAGSAVNDAGTEVNDELPANTAFFGQAAPDTGVAENGVNTVHPGFKAAAMGGILDDAMFSAGDFTAAGYEIATVKIEQVFAAPMNVRVTFTSAAPVNGTFATPPWVGFHDGSFDTYDEGVAASVGLERIAEDGNPGPLREEFSAANAGSADGVLNEAGPIGPGSSTSMTFTLDANSAQSQFFSYVSMVIPSNDAFFANGDPHAHRLFDDNGTFQPIEFDVLGSVVRDAGTEVNDELPANTAFFGQAVPDTGVAENGTVSTHPGFKAKGMGGILDDAMFSAADFTGNDYKIGTFKVELLQPELVDVFVTVTNTAPDAGTYLTPVWVAFHDGGVDTYDSGVAASAGLERIAEDGNPGRLSSEFLASGAGSDGVLDGIGPIAPGATVTKRFTIDANSPMSRYFSYASMIIPSNDAFIANCHPTAHQLFNGAGGFMPLNIDVLGAQVLDAGTETNDELPANTAFFGQATPDTGVAEGGVVMPHPGFKPLADSGILADSKFAGADFTAEGYSVANVSVELVRPKPVSVTFTLVNNAPENGVFLTPVWLGVHDGSFELFNQGETVSSGLERIAEDGNTAPLSEIFLAHAGAGFDTTVASEQGIPPFAPGDTAEVTFTLDANNPKHRYLSFASMIIPSNDAFIGNSDPMAHTLFDGAGNFIGSSVLRLGNQVYDAGTEVNDETPANTAFFGQAAPDTGTAENGTVALHAGFNAVGSGGILDDPMFAGADFTAASYPLFNLEAFETLLITQAELNGKTFSLAWTGGRAPYLVEWSEDLRTWMPAGDLSDQTSLDVETDRTAAFFRVLSGASALEPAP